MKNFHYWLLGDEGFLFMIGFLVISLLSLFFTNKITKNSEKTDILITKIAESKVHKIIINLECIAFITYAVIAGLFADLSDISLVRKGTQLFISICILGISFVLFMNFILTIICFFIASFKKSKDD